MKRYPAEYKEWVVEQMMPPLNRSVVELAKETGVTTVSLRTWRKEAREQGKVVPGNGKQSDKCQQRCGFRQRGVLALQLTLQVPDPLLRGLFLPTLRQAQLGLTIPT